MATQRDWAGVPELPDDAALMSSSFLSELPLSQAFQPSQSWKKISSSSSLTGREKRLHLDPTQAYNEVDEAPKGIPSSCFPQSQSMVFSQENTPANQTAPNIVRNSHKRPPTFRPPLIHTGSQRHNISKSVYQIQDTSTQGVTQTLVNYGSCRKDASRPDHGSPAEGHEFGPTFINEESQRKSASRPIYLVPSHGKDYVPPYRSINVNFDNSDQQYREDNVMLLGRSRKQQFDNVKKKRKNLLPSSAESDSEPDSPVPASPLLPKRFCFQFSQVQKPSPIHDRDIVQSSQSQKHLGINGEHSVPTLSSSEDLKANKYDKNVFLSTPHLQPERRHNPPDSGFCDYTSPAETLNTPASLYLSNTNRGTTSLRSVEEILSYRHVFEFPYFNMVQSIILDDVLYTDKALVVSAPTGAGKTVLFELAIIRMLAIFGETKKNWKIVYVAPMKALCSERYLDWTRKFETHGLNCMELTGDTELDSIAELHKTNLILTTPEKWDSMSRKWKDNRSFFQMIVLFLTDEIHILNDNTRGSTIEAVISRMKTLRLANKKSDNPAMRFVAVSATIPNIEDIATWLGNSVEPASSFNLGEKYRPVKLMKIVVGYPFKEGFSDFRFDMNLAYRLKGIIETYSNNKPTLVFCSSRKSVEQTADVLKKEHYGRSLVKPQNRDAVQKGALLIKEGKIADMVRFGIGVHHAGLGTSDRKQVEDLFRKGLLPVLVSTSTLAMGVNLPAHLVVIKSTVFYSMGTATEYSDSQVLQMIGRAGRPQFDTSATAVIMTKSTTKSKYENLVNGTQMIESSLHKHLIEHLNAEVVLHTITDIALAVEWIRHTFLYVRVMKNPTHYGYPPGLDKKQVEKRLEELCLQNLNELAGLKLVTMDPETYAISPTETGKLMARYCITFDTMKKFHTVGNKEGAKDMMDLIVGCSEFDEFIHLRNNEKSTLNALNKNKNKQTIRLMQAQLSCLPIQDFSLSQDVLKIFRVGQRVAKCLMEFLWQRNDYNSLLTAIELFKSIKTKLWVDSKYVAKQLDGIGQTMSQSLANAGMTTFQKLEETNPRELELIVNRHPPFGNQIRDAVAVLPKYEMSIEQLKNYKTKASELVVSITLANREIIQDKKGSTDHQSVLLIGDQDNAIVFKWRIIDSLILRDLSWRRKIDVTRAMTGPELFIHLISQEYVGLDIHTTYVPVYQWSCDYIQITNYKANQEHTVQGKCVPPSNRNLNQPERASTPTSSRRLGQCQHKCINKTMCRHRCCKEGLETSGERIQKQDQTNNTMTKTYQRRGIESQIRTLKNRATNLGFQSGPDKRQRMTDFQPGIGLQQFAYQKPESMKLSHPSRQYPQAPAQVQPRTVPKNLQSTLGNLPVFRYGVGGRRIDLGRNPELQEPSVDVHTDVSDGEFDTLYIDDFENEFQDNFAENSFTGNEIIHQQRNQQEASSNTARSVQGSSYGSHIQRSDTADQQQVGRDTYDGDLGQFHDLDSVFESYESPDSVAIQEVPSANHSRRQSPHFSQDAWAELHIYQQEREASFHDEENVDPPVKHSATEDQVECTGYHHSNIYESSEKWPSGFAVNNTADFLESNSSDDDLCFAEESIKTVSRPPRTKKSAKNVQNFSNRQSLAVKYQSNKQETNFTKGNKSHKRSTDMGCEASGTKEKTGSCKSPMHRYGQVVAWVADSDSSPLSQKSNPNSKTPLFKKISQKLDNQQKSMSKSDLWGNSSDEIFLDTVNQLHDENKSSFATNAICPKTLSFFHVFSAGKNDDMTEISGNIFAGVF